MALDAQFHASTAFGAGGAVSARSEHNADRFGGADHALGGCGRKDLVPHLLEYPRVAHEALFHPRAALDAGDAVTARLEGDSDRFRRTHHTQ